MDRWNSRGESSQRREEKKKEVGRERVRRKKIKACEKVEKPRSTVFFSNVLWLRRAEKWAR